MMATKEKPPLPAKAAARAHNVAAIRAAQALHGTAMTVGQVNAAMAKLRRRSRGDDLDYRNRPESVDALLAELGLRRGG
jgi:hypothetical protein